MMDYKQMAEIVTKEVDAILERKKRRAILIKRISITASGLCAAAIVGIGVWHSRDIKPSLEHSDIPVISETPETTQQSSEYSETAATSITTAETSITTADATTETAVTSSEYDNTYASETSLSSTVTVNTDVSTESTSESATTKNNFTTQTTSASTEKAVTSTSYVTAKTSTTRIITTVPVSTTTRTTTKVTVTTAPYSTIKTTSSTARPIVTTPFVPPQPRTTVSTTGGSTVTTVYIPPTTYTRPTTTTSVGTGIVFSYDITCRAVDEYTYQNVPGINMRLYEVKQKKAYDGHPIIDGEPVLLAEWNTSSTPEFTYSYLTGTINEYAYYVASDKLPYGYNFHQSDKIRSGLGKSFYNDIVRDIILGNGEPSKKSTDIPLKGTYSLDISIEDYNNRMPLKDLDCEVYDADSGNVITRWNTSDTEIMHLEGLSYEYENDDLLTDTGKKVYKIRIKNLPENLHISNGNDRNETIISCRSITDFENGTELLHPIYIVNNN